MLDLTLHTRETAPSDAVEAVDAAQKAYGFVPNLIANLANAPAAARAYMAVAEAFDGSSLSAQEQQLVLLATSFENRCHYCMAAHSVVGGMAGLSDPVIEAVRDGTEISDNARLEALRAFTVSVVDNRGWVPEEDIRAFLDAGFAVSAVLEVLTGVTLKTLSNYMNHMAVTPVDPQFEAARWTHPEEREPAAV